MSATPQQFNLMAELITSGKPGDYCVEQGRGGMRIVSTHFLRDHIVGPEGAPAALIDTVITGYFEESHAGQAVRAYRSSYTTSGRAVKAGGSSYTRMFTNTDFDGLPERIHHGEVARYSAKSLAAHHVTAVNAYSAPALIAA